MLIEKEKINLLSNIILVNVVYIGSSSFALLNLVTMSNVFISDHHPSLADQEGSTYVMVSDLDEEIFSYFHD